MSTHKGADLLQCPDLGRLAVQSGSLSLCGSLRAAHEDPRSDAGTVDHGGGLPAAGAVEGERGACFRVGGEPFGDAGVHGDDGVVERGAESVAAIAGVDRQFA